MITGPWGQTVNRFFRNSRGQLTAIRDGTGKAVTLHYNREGMLDSIRYPATPVARTHFVVSAAHRLAGAASTVAHMSHAYTYSSIGLMMRDSIASGLGFYHQYGYDAMGRIGSWELHRMGKQQVCYDPRDCFWHDTDEVIASRSFAWDGVGQSAGRDPLLGSTVVRTSHAHEHIGGCFRDAMPGLRRRPAECRRWHP